MGSWFRREKRLNEFPLPRSLQESFERAQRLSTPEAIVWIESTSLGINRLVDKYRETRDVETLWDAYDHALQIVGLLRAQIERTQHVEL